MGNFQCCEEALPEGPYRLEVQVLSVDCVPKDKIVRLRLQMGNDVESTGPALYREDCQCHVWSKEEMVMYGSCLRLDVLTVSLIGLEGPVTELVPLYNSGLRRDVEVPVLLETAYPVHLAIKLRPTSIHFNMLTRRLRGSASASDFSQSVTCSNPSNHSDSSAATHGSAAGPRVASDPALFPFGLRPHMTSGTVVLVHMDVHLREGDLDGGELMYLGRDDDDGDSLANQVELCSLKGEASPYLPSSPLMADPATADR